MKKIFLLATFITFFFSALNTLSAQNFRVLSNNIVTTIPLECDTVAVDVTTYLGCRNFVNNGYTYSVSGNIITIAVKYTSSPICLGALSQPIFNVKMVGITAGSYTISSEAYLDNVFTNAVTTPITIGTCCPSTSQLKASFFMTDSLYCIGDTFYLNNLSFNANSYEWFKNDTSFSTLANPFIIASKVGMNTIRLRADSGLCVDDTSLNYRVNSNPMVSLGADTIICQGASITLTTNNLSSSYFWQDSTTLDSLVVSSAGNYSVVVTDTNGCIGSDSILVGVSVCTFTAENSVGKVNWSFYPNPAKESINIVVKSKIESPISYRITDLNGKLLSEGLLSKSNNEITTADLPTGMYLIQLIENSQITTKKLTIK